MLEVSENNTIEVDHVKPSIHANGAFGQLILEFKDYEENKNYKFSMDGNFSEYLLKGIYWGMNKSSDFPTNLSYGEFIDIIDKYMMEMRLRYWYIKERLPDEGTSLIHRKELKEGYYYVSENTDKTGEGEIFGPYDRKVNVIITKPENLGLISKFFFKLGL